MPRGAVAAGVGACLLLCVVGLAGCGDDGDAVVGRWRPHACWSAAPAGVEVTCGTVAVPERRTQAAAGDDDVVTLAVAIVHSRAATPVPDPVVFLAGGPGSPAIRSAFAMLPAFEPFLAERDLVVIDQRGAGDSTPSLACLPAEDPTACRDRLLADGVDLAGYTTRENAADVADVVRALDLDEVNLLGGSYGTRLGLAVLRDHPEVVRAAVLDSVAPVQVATGPGVARSTASGLHVLAEGCRADATCREEHGDVEAALAEAVRELDASPASLDVGGSAVRVDGAMLLALLVSAQYYTEAIPELPAVIDAAADGDLGPYARLAGAIAEETGDLDGALSTGMMWSVECAENVPFETPADFAAAVADLDPAVGGHVVGSSLFATGICDVWDVPAVDAVDRAPVHADVPTLLLAGEYDPVTPPAWAELAAETLTAAQVQAFPGAGHGVFRTSPCARSMIAAFLADPTATVDDGCVATMPPPDFR